MTTLTVTAKGQITLRKDTLTHLGINPGDKVVIDKLPNHRIELRAERPAGSISNAFGFLKRDNGACLSIDAMNEVAAAGWAGKR